MSTWIKFVALTVVLGLMAALLSGPGQAGQTQKEAGKANPAATPSPRAKGGTPDANWMKRHDGFVAIAKKGGVEVLFQGDSITDGWRNQAAWKKHFEPIKSANFGIGGDRTEHVLWRLENGELDGIQPKLMVLMIGTNNTGANSAEQIADGIKAIVKTTHAKSPKTKVLLLGVFPRGKKEDVPRKKVEAINKIISAYDDAGKTVKYMDIGDKFLQKDGAIITDLMNKDLLHLTAKGYDVWGEAIIDAVRSMAQVSEKK